MNKQLAHLEVGGPDGQEFKVDLEKEKDPQFLQTVRGMGYRLVTRPAVE